MSNGIEKEKKCEICEAKATKICFDCLNYLCDSCFEYIHDKNNNSRHDKEYVHSYNSINIKCPKHPNNVINLFCSNEKSKKLIFLIFEIFRIILSIMLSFRRT